MSTTSTSRPLTTSITFDDAMFHLPATASPPATACERQPLFELQPMDPDRFARLAGVQRNRAVIVVPASTRALRHLQRPTGRVHARAG